MGRKKLLMKPIENPTSRQVTYTKRRDGIFKKAHELSVLCDTDVGLILFSPDGRLNGFASDGRVEDIFLRYVGMPHELRAGPIDTEEERTNLYLSEKLKHMKHEAEMLEKIAVIEELEEKLKILNKKKSEAHDKMRYYKPNIQKIDSVVEAEVYEQHLTTALERVHLSKAKLLDNQVIPELSINCGGQEQAPIVQTEGANSSWRDAISRGKKPMVEEDQYGSSLSMGGPRLSLIMPESQWNNN